MSEDVTIEQAEPDGLYVPDATGTATMVLELPAEEPAEQLTQQVPRQLPWAGITTGKAEDDELLTSTQMLARAGLDWEVGLRPLKRHLSDGRVLDATEYETYRADNEEIQLGSVKSRYELLQNREAFDFGDSLVQSNLARWAEAGLQSDGKQVFMTMLLDEEFMVLGHEAFKIFMFFSTSHNGSRSLAAAITPIRGFCLNQSNIIAANNHGRFVIQHTSSMKGKLEQAAESIRMAGSYSDMLKAQAETLASIQVTDDKARRLITSIIPERRSRREAMIDGIMANYATSENAGDAGTGWRLLNATTEYMDHLKPTRSGNARYESITFGEGAKFRTKLVTALAELN